LKQLFMKNNLITGPMTLKQTSLIDLDASGNLIDPLLWPGITEWSKIFLNVIPNTIQNMNFANNKINGQWSAANFNGNQNSLQRLILSHNQIKTIPSDFFGANNYRVIDLS